MKKYLLDTNVLLHSPNSLFAFDDNEVYIPITVIEELDTFKNGNSEINANARKVIRHLDDIRQQGDLSLGVAINDGQGILRVLMNEDIECNYNLADDKILAYAQKFDAILVTKDMNLRVKANAKGVKAEDYLHDKVENGQNIIQELAIDDDALAKAYAVEDVYVHFNDDELEQFFINNYVMLRSKNGCKTSGVLTRYCGNGIFTKIEQVHSIGKITPKNYEQRFLIDALMDEDIKIVIVNGVAGSGKTLLSLTCGLEQTIEKSIYKRVVLTKSTVTMGGSHNDLGFLPGELNSKLQPYLKSFLDNIEFLDLDYNYLTEIKKIEIEALGYIRGRTFNNAFIIADECQNMSPLEIKQLLTRIGKHSKIVLLGDVSQIDNQYLDKYDNGLSYAMHKLKGDKIVACIQMTKSERSEIAKLAIERM